MKEFNLDWEKMNNLIPVVIQDAHTLQVLMLGYMNPLALQQTLETELVTFYSRSKQHLWTKGETSGNTLRLIDIHHDCDQDALLVLVNPQGPTCHQGNRSCFKDNKAYNFLAHIEEVIEQRIQEGDKDSYVKSVMQQGTNRIAQKVGEEAVETVIAALSEPEKFKDETADLLFHLLLLMRSQEVSLKDIDQTLKARHKKP